MIGQSSTQTAIIDQSTGLRAGVTNSRLNVDVGNVPINSIAQDSAQYYCDSNQLYSLGIDISMATSGVDNPLVLIRNPTGSGKKVFIWRLQAGATINNVSAEFKLFSTPTVTVNGTSQTPVARNINNSQPAAITLVTSLPTVSANGSSFGSITQGQNANSIVFDSEFSVCLQPNSAILLTGNPGSNNRNAAISFSWSEVDL